MIKKLINKILILEIQMVYGNLQPMGSMIKVNTVISQLLTQLKQLRQIRTTTDKQRNKTLVTIIKIWNM